MPEVKQPNSSKVRSTLHEYASELTSTPNGDIVCKFCDYLVKSDKRFMVEVSFMKLKVQDIFKTCHTRFGR